MADQRPGSESPGRFFWRTSKFGNGLLAGVVFIAETLAPEAAVKAGLMIRPVNKFMPLGGGVALRIPESAG